MSIMPTRAGHAVVQQTPGRPCKPIVDSSMSGTVATMNAGGNVFGGGTGRHRVLVLSGGGLHGALQAGMLAELVETGWRPDVVVGVSVGALNGVWVASNWDTSGAEELVRLWDNMKSRPVFHSNRWTQLRNVLRGRSSLQSADTLIQVLDEACPVEYLEQSSIPVQVGAMNASTGSTTWFTSGSAHPRLLASASVPGVVPPVEINGETYVDGGVLANIPVSRGVEIGGAELLVLDVSGDQLAGPLPSSALGVLLRSYDSARRQLMQSDLEAALESGAAVHHVRASVPDGLGSTDWHRCPELVALGRNQMKAWLENAVKVVAV